ncbi:patatin-like phospholipase family protein [Salisediminibacterium halotolerans]|uniref:Predicted phospholipase, patatin/cPLA2 family n=1 Tax=Salisediminibacterium halotolerans TaxID=517425 RepID=A0A1H9WEU5_9BACI|nr:patatin family protein [Salisediminibacterium haloalkalitolerans]SES32456.1 Predicted phospholipase, patatin/cPLA2 family [Salisediminibacterium haloalkalitolerans]
MISSVGLVLEGGAMRGVFSGGVLEYFLKENLEFPYVVGVSAGACNAASFISKQEKRNKDVTIGYSNHPDYISIKRLLKRGELFNMDLIFDRIPNVERPFDYDKFYYSPTRFHVGTTDCVTGQTVYFEKNEIVGNFNKILRASSSLPMLAPPIKHNGRYLLDGGISDPVPIQKSVEDGNDKHVIVLTQSEGYRKKAASKGMWYFERKYKDYPGLINVVQNRYRIYNDTIDYIHQLEREGRAFVFRPDDLRGVTRMERNRSRLESLYDHGYNLSQNKMTELQQFLSDSEGNASNVESS